MIKLEVCVVERYADGLWKPVGRYHTKKEAEDELDSPHFDPFDYHLARMIERNKTIYLAAHHEGIWHELTLNTRAHTLIDPEFILDLDSTSKHQNILSFWLHTNDARSIGEILSNIYSPNEIFDILCACAHAAAKTLSSEEKHITAKQIENVSAYKHKKAEIARDASVLPNALEMLEYFASHLRSKRMDKDAPNRNTSFADADHVIDALCDDLNTIRGGRKSVCVREVADFLRQCVPLHDMVSHLVKEILRSANVYDRNMSRRAA